MAAPHNFNVPYEDPNNRQIPPDTYEDYGSGESNQARSPLSAFGFLKGFSSEKKLKADGQPPKRRGPKPDSKPALTRRQELNRQAQRTHRERKELYIKALEQEVLRLKESYGQVCCERDAAYEDNRRLRELLAAHGIPAPAELTPTALGYSSTSVSGSASGGYLHGSSTTSDPTPPPLSGLSPHSHGHANFPYNSSQQQQNVDGHQVEQQGSNTGINYDQVGINFVLALERPCMDHMQMLCVKSQSAEEEISGHALMSTCPPASHMMERPDEPYPHKLPDGVPHGDLLKLLDLSSRLPLDGEITPVMAWACILRDERRDMLSMQDFNVLREELKNKVRCYGFGAVLEEFEVRDAIENIVATRQRENTSAVEIGPISSQDQQYLGPTRTGANPASSSASNLSVHTTVPHSAPVSAVIAPGTAT